MSLLLRKKPDWFHSLSVKEPVTELLRHKHQKLENVFVSKYQQSHFEKVKSFLSQWFIYIREVKKPEIKFASIVHDVDVQMLAGRQRARYLRLVQPPNSRELKCVRGQMNKQTLLHKTARSYYVISLSSYLFRITFYIWLSKLHFCFNRDLTFHLIMLLTVLFVTYGKSDNDNKYHLNQAIKSHFTK